MDGAVKMKQGYLLFHVNILFSSISEKDYQKVIDLSYSTIVMTVPSIVFFIVLPILLKFKQNFVFSLIVSIISTAIAYAIFMFIIKKLNFNF